VWLKKGGYLVIDQTEALVSIDVNTGRFTGKKNQEDTIFKTNIEAAREAAAPAPAARHGRHHRHRLHRHGDRVEQEGRARRAAPNLKRRPLAHEGVRRVGPRPRRDDAPARTPSLLAYYSEDCPTCTAIGKILSLESVMVKLERLLRRLSAAARRRRLVVRVAPEVAVYILEHNGRRLAESRAALQASTRPQGRSPGPARGDPHVLGAHKQEITDQYTTR
jgi:ribonuclease G